MAYQGHGPSKAPFDGRGPWASGGARGFAAGGVSLCLVAPERYDRIQERRTTRNWTVEDGRCPLDNFDDHFKRIRKLTSIECGTFHDLRRTCLSNWIAQGLSLYEVKELAGHGKIETTERFYLAVRKDVVDRARLALAASRKGNSVARPLREPTREKAPKRKCFEALIL